MSKILENKWFQRICWGIAFILCALTFNRGAVDWTTPQERARISEERLVSGCVLKEGWIAEDGTSHKEWEKKLTKCHEERRKAFSHWTAYEIDTYFYHPKSPYVRKLITVYPTQY